MLVVDTGPLVAYLNRNDVNHGRCTELLDSYWGELIVTPYVLAESCYLIAKYVNPDAEINLVETVAAGEIKQARFDSDDLARIAELMRRYRGFPLGIADMSVVALAEREKVTTVATLDHRHFRAITPRHTSAFTLLP